MWAFQTQGPDAVPDIVTLGKPIGNGHPIACVITTPEIAKSFENIGTEYFNTVNTSTCGDETVHHKLLSQYGGNPVSLAVANAVLDVIENENLMQHASKVGNFLLAAFDKMKLRYDFVGDVRGMGLFIGIDMVTSPLTKEPATQLADFVVKRCKQLQIIISTEGKYGNVIKFKPPMVFTNEDAKHLLNVITMCFDEINYLFQKGSSTSSITESLNSSDDETTCSETDSYN